MDKPYRIAIVLDRQFGDRLVTLDGPVWIIDSLENQAAARICWDRNPTASHLDGITVFKSFDVTSPEDALIANLDIIELHHGEYSAPIPYSILEVVGALRNPKIETELAAYGFNRLEDTPDGFRAIRTGN